MSELLTIDVSKHQGVIDWNAVKNSGVKAAIIRCGFGSDIAKQDDNQFEANVRGCIENGIPFGVYIYSYANNIEMAQSEAAHVRRLCDKYKEYFCLPLFYDLEEAGTESAAVECGKEFIRIMEAAGYEVGIYANEYWFRNVLGSAFDDHTLWVAKYGCNDGNKHEEPKISGNISLWQFTSVGSILGINGNVDLSTCYIEPKAPKQPSNPVMDKTIEELARDVLSGKYGVGEARKNALGSRYNEVQARVNAIKAEENKHEDKAPQMSVDECARLIVEGKGAWAVTGADRKMKVQGLGLNYDEVQVRVNYIMNGNSKPTPAPQSAAPQPVYYTIVYGDTLSGIANRFGTSVDTLCAMNGIPDPNKIFAGKTIRVQ